MSGITLPGFPMLIPLRLKASGTPFGRPDSLGVASFFASSKQDEEPENALHEPVAIGSPNFLLLATPEDRK